MYRSRILCPPPPVLTSPLSLSLSGSGRHAAPRQLNLGGKMCRRDVLSIAGARPMGSLIFCWVLGRGSGPPANKDIFSGPSPGGARGWRHRGSPGTIHSTHCIYMLGASLQMSDCLTQTCSLFLKSKQRMQRLSTNHQPHRLSNL